MSEEGEITKMNIDYKIVIEDTPIELELSVRRWIREGWRLQGGIAVSRREGEGNRVRFYQAMIN